MSRIFNRTIWIWQTIISPHMAGLAVELAKLGCKVTYVAEQVITPERSQQGWSQPILRGVRLEIAPSTESVRNLLASAPLDSIHICSGIRSNGLIRIAQKELSQQRLRQWIVMETVDDIGWRGSMKRLEYRRLFTLRRGQVQGILAIGDSTPAWVSERGMPNEKVFPFAYFLPKYSPASYHEQKKFKRYRFLFVGRFIELKRLGFLIKTMNTLSSDDFEFAVVGSGPLGKELQIIAESAFPGRLDWIGQLPLEAVADEMARADCLVLPSRHDGWGAVVSEAMMVGTPVICSHTCGAAGVVRASGYGHVFASGNKESLAQSLNTMITKGPIPWAEKLSLMKWAECLGDKAGAKYLLQLLRHAEGKADRPVPPWLAS